MAIDYSPCVELFHDVSLIQSNVCLFHEATGGWWFAMIVVVLMAASYYYTRSVYILAGVSLLTSGAAYVWMPPYVQMATYLITAFAIGAAIYVFFAAEDGN